PATPSTRAVAAMSTSAAGISDPVSISAMRAPGNASAMAAAVSPVSGPPAAVFTTTASPSPSGPIRDGDTRAAGPVRAGADGRGGQKALVAQANPAPMSAPTITSLG